MVLLVFDVGIDHLAHDPDRIINRFNMKEYGYHIVRVGLAITFLWIGILILRDPESWGAMVQPWVLKLMPLPIKEIMLSTAVLDMVIGFFLLIDVFTWLLALIGALHLVTVLAVTGINAITVRDIGLLAGLLALFVTKFPRRKEASNQ